MGLNNLLIVRFQVLTAAINKIINKINKSR
jgi:hypothetical protein